MNVMPELPEVETTRRALLPILGRAVEKVDIIRPDFVTAVGGGAVTAARLLRGQRLVTLERRGKEMILAGDGGGALGLHLGMTGSLQWITHPAAPGEVVRRRDHVHVRWLLDDGSAVQFRDPRRFGGVWAYGSLAEALAARWGKLGPDALTLTPKVLQAALQVTRRPIKAALLDQTVVAGLGNIYTDEALFAARIHPARRADLVTEKEIQLLVKHILKILNLAVKEGGSSVRDYVNALGAPGWFQIRHQVYGRGGESCRRCQAKLVACTLGGRTTVYCKQCQPRTRRRAGAVVRVNKKMN